MAYAGIQMFMKKLKQLINCNDNPLINTPSVINEKPQLQLLYDELGSMIQILFIEEHLHEHEKLNDLKKRFTDAAEEAQYIVDLFLSGICDPKEKRGQIIIVSDYLNHTLNLDDVMTLFKSVKVEYMSMRIDSMKMDHSSRRTERTTLNQSAAAQIRHSIGSKKIQDEIIVGIDHDAELIRDKLLELQKKLVVVSIVGMGGIGKTTLAAKIFNDPFVVHHFHVRAWATVSGTYDKLDVLTQILASIGVKPDLEDKFDSSTLREMVHKHLMGKRYLIVIDDVWQTETWDKLKVFFPHDNNGSRILLTSRLTEVAKHANSNGLVHHLGYLDQEIGWELLSKKVFHDINTCPEWSIKPGMQIVENCQGLPLAIVVIAGVLAKEACSEEFWVEIAIRTGQYIVGDQNGCLETLALSYNHLPLYLRECFLYLGGFPEGYKFQVQRLIWLWMAEGFIQQAGNQSLEATAEGYLMDLIDRNLVIVADTKKSNGAVKAFKMHDLVRELCLKKAKEDQFILEVERLVLSSEFFNVSTPPYKPVRMFIYGDSYLPNTDHLPEHNIRSILFSIMSLSLYKHLKDDIKQNLDSFVLLWVLDLHNCVLYGVPKDIKLLVHLRYLAIWNSSEELPPSICNLWNLQTLIYTRNYRRIVLPSNISDLVNLRHLWSYIPCSSESKKTPFFLPSIAKPMNLQSISNVELGEGVNTFHECFPFIKELRCTIYLDEENDFKSLNCLEKLKLTAWDTRRKSTVTDSPEGDPSCGKIHITFPATLKSLTLFGCGLPWSHMSIIHSLPNLQVLKLHYKAFEGSCWNTDEEEFRQLKFLRLEKLDIELWEACSTSFPCLRQLEILACEDLEEVPLEIWEIPTLKHIKIKNCRRSVGKSVRRIQEEQQNWGNYDIKIDISKHVGTSLFRESLTLGSPRGAQIYSRKFDKKEISPCGLLGGLLESLEGKE